MNMMTRLLAGVALATGLVSAPALAQTATIDFSGHGTGGQIGNTYANLGVTFSTAAFFQCGGGCPAPTPNGYFASDFPSPFTAFFSTAQSSISFQSVSNSSTVANAYNAMGDLVATVSDSEAFPVSNKVDVLSGAGITRVVFGGTGPAVTNLTFSVAAVPEPATWAMMLVGFGAIGVAMRRRQKGAPRVSYAAA